LTNEEMAHSYLRIAKQTLKQAESSLRDEAFSLAVRRAQETVEMGLKGVLRLVGVEVPKIHDVGVILKEHRNLYPDWFQVHVDRMAMISRTLRKDREASLYGDEMLDVPPDRIFGRLEADSALADARFVLEQCQKVAQEHRSG